MLILAVRDPGLIQHTVAALVMPDALYCVGHDAARQGRVITDGSLYCLQWRRIGWEVGVSRLDCCVGTDDHIPEFGVAALEIGVLFGQFGAGGFGLSLSSGKLNLFLRIGHGGYRLGHSGLRSGDYPPIEGVH